MRARTMTVAAALVAAALLSTMPGQAAPGDPGQPLVVDEGLTGLFPFAATSDGSTFVYSRIAGVGDPAHLTVIEVDGGTPRQISERELTLEGGQVAIDEVGGRVVFKALADDGSSHLYSVGLDGSAEVDLTPALPATATIQRFAISPDGDQVIVMADLALDDVVELYAVPTDGGPITRRGSELAAGRSVTSFVLSPDGQRILYLADELVDDKHELFVTSLTSSEDGVALLPPSIGASMDVAEGFQITPDSSRAVYVADAAADGHPDLFSVRLDATEDPIALSSDTAPENDLAGRFVVSSDGTFVLYVVQQLGEVDRAVYRVPIDGATPPENLLTDPTENGVGLLIDPASPVGVVVLQVEGTASVFAVGATTVVELLRPTEASFLSFGIAMDRFHYVLRGPELGGVLASVPLAGGTPTELFAVEAPETIALVDQSNDGKRLVAVVGPPVNRGGAPAESSRTLAVPVAGGQVVTLTRGGPAALPFVVSDTTALLVELVQPPTRMLSVRLGYLCEGELATITGTNQPDELTGTRGRDVIVGRGGGDRIDGRGGPDLVCAGGGADTVRGGGGDDALLGQRGRDRLVGGRGPDTCIGGGGRDTARSCTTQAGVP